MMKGRPILGVISGFFFGLFGGLTLFMFGAIPLASPLLWVLPLVGIVFGLVMAAWAPFGKMQQPAAAGDSGVTYAASGAATMSDMTVEDNPIVEQPDTSAGDDDQENGTIEQ